MNSVSKNISNIITEKLIQNKKMQKEKLTVLVPYKDREDNLKVFIPYMTNYLNKNFPSVPYEIIIIEQCNDKLFNKGILFNAGFLLTSGNTDYYALHDIDELPISAVYLYNENPFHICVNIYEQSSTGVISNFYKDDGLKHRGGAFIINKDKYIKANGHSNLYWGWGPIDINFSYRLEWCGSSIFRYKRREANDSGYFISLRTNNLRFDDPTYNNNQIIEEKLKSGEIDWKTDGLNNVNFELLKTIVKEDYTLFKITF